MVAVLVDDGNSVVVAVVVDNGNSVVVAVVVDDGNLVGDTARVVIARGLVGVPMCDPPFPNPS